jgi:hypothetical protein
VFHTWRYPAFKTSTEQGRWGQTAVSALHRKQYVQRIFLCFLGSPILGSKLAMHVKNIQVVFILSPFKFILKTVTKALLRKAGYPGVCK